MKILKIFFTTFVNLHGNHIERLKNIRIVKILHMKVMRLKKQVIYFSGFFGMMILVVGRDLPHLLVGMHLHIMRQEIG